VEQAVDPPRSTNAPKSVMFLTTPSRIWSFARSLRMVDFMRSRSPRARRGATPPMLRRRLFSLMILTETVWPSRHPRSAPAAGRSASPAGRPRPRRGHDHAALILRTSRPSTTCPVSWASLSGPRHARSPRAAWRGRRGRPGSPSSRGTLEDVAHLDARRVRELRERDDPSLLKPTSTSTSFSSRRAPCPHDLALADRAQRLLVLPNISARISSSARLVIRVERDGWR